MGLNNEYRIAVDVLNLSAFVLMSLEAYNHLYLNTNIQTEASCVVASQRHNHAFFFDECVSVREPSFFSPFYENVSAKARL